MKRRKHATYRCAGTDCPLVHGLRLKVPKGRGPKMKPPAWRMTRARWQDPATGILRELSVLFCSDACLADPDQVGPLSRRIHSYLGAPGPPPPVVTYRCVVCEATQELNAPQHTAEEMAVPMGWSSMPLIAADYDSGMVRMTSMPICSDACVESMVPTAEAAAQPPATGTELERLFDGITNEEKARVIGAGA